jgi:hypothetical protein
MSNSYVWQYGFSSTIAADNQTPEDHPTSGQEPSDEESSTSQRAMMVCKEQITLFCNLQGTFIGSINLTDFCEVNKDVSGADADVVTLPYSLRATWKSILAKRVIEYLVVGHLRFQELQILFIADDKFLISQLTHNRASKTCGCATTFRQKMTTSIAENTTFRVSLCLLLEDMTALGLLYRENLAPPPPQSVRPCSCLGSNAVSHRGPASSDPPAPNKLDI